MVSFAACSFLWFVLVTTVVGCNLGPWGGPAYTIDPAKLGTGEQAIVPRNDSEYANGMPMDMRTRR